MTEETGLQELINAGGLTIMAQLASLEKEKKSIEAADKKARDQLTALCDQYGVKSIDNEYVRISYVEPKSTTSIDLATVKKKEPDFYAGLLQDFPLSVDLVALKEGNAELYAALLKKYPSTVDMAALQKSEPDTYAGLEKDYAKVTTRKGYVRITVK